MKMSVNSMKLNWFVTGLALALAVVAGGGPLF